MKFVSLFAGIGGLDLGLERAGHTCVGQVEIDDYATKVLEKHWPDVPRIRDVRDFHGHEFGEFDLLVGGYPCQPFSVAGSRQGDKDDRHLWPEVLRIVRNVRPQYLLVENVTGHLSLGFERVLGDLAESGYDAEWDCIPAAAVGAPHRRDRVFIIATRRAEELADARCEYRESRNPAKLETETGVRATSAIQFESSGKGRGIQKKNVAYANIAQRERDSSAIRIPKKHADISSASWWAIEPDVGRGIDGFSRIVDGDISNEAKARANQILQNLHIANDAQALWEQTGAFRGVSTQEILFAILCEYERAQDGGWLASDCAEAREQCLRGVWKQIELARSPLQSRRDGQQPSEFTDALRKLSRNASSLYAQAWAKGIWEDGIQRVENGILNRVDRLKALGNAVVPQVAEWIGRRLPL